MRRKDVKLYNVLFPLWMLLMLPPFWLVVIPGNFLIDSAVLLISMAALRLSERKQLYKMTILKIFIFGMISDVIGSAYMILMMLFDMGDMYDELYITVPALIISAAMIFVFNYFVTFRRLDRPIRLKLAVIFATVTAPYTFLVPFSWLYGF